MAEGGGSPSTPRESPPKAVIDTSPILMDQNKESLKVKLLLRRPFDQLVAQGIMPPHKTPAAYHGQRRQLERAKTGDMLKAKIQQRPPRQELERRHILEADPNHVDPSLAERQRMLKKARLADQLNDQLSHRPGPLELIQKNILHTEEPIEQAVKTGRIPYKATSEGQLNRPQHPQSYITPEEDSQSSEGDNLVSSPGPSDVLETAAKSAGIVVSLIQPPDGTIVPVDINSSEIVFANLCGTVLQSAASPVSLLSTSTLSPLSSIASPVPSILSQPATPAPVPVPPPLPPIRAIQSDAPGKDKNHRKKSKSKSAPKTRTIKFHEYKGPPSAHKVNNALSPNSGESSYDLLLKQQTLLLQFQLQLQHKYPQIILPAGQKQNATETCNNINTQQASPAPSTSSESSTQIRITGRLEDMKVNDLKAELKRRSLPVSGSKPQLIERLKPFTNSDQINLVDSSSIHSDHSQDIGSPNGSVKDDHSERMELDPMSPNVESKTNEELVREQQRQIEELQRELTLSHMKLQAVAATNKPKHELLVLQKHIQAKQQQNLAAQMRQLQEQQAREQVNEEQKRIQQQQHVAFQNQKNLPGGLLFNGADAALLFSQLLQQGKAKLINGNNSGNFIIATPEIKVEEAKPPPPLYEEATKQIKKSNVKSQIVQDVLEILIENGELPPSAANDPSTPNSAGVKPVEPVYPKPIEVSFDNDNLPQVLDSLDSLDNMDINELVGELAASHNPQDNVNNNAELMMDADDTDAWFESLITSNSVYNNSAPQEVDYDPVFGLHQDPFDPDPFNLEEFRSPADLNTSWDKFDYAA